LRQSRRRMQSKHDCRSIGVADPDVRPASSAHTGATITECEGARSSTL
jgi:hypothetical protein